MDTTKERDALQSTLTNVQMLCDSESKARADLEATVQKLTDQLNFERQIHDKVKTVSYSSVVITDIILFLFISLIIYFYIFNFILRTY